MNVIKQLSVMDDDKPNSGNNNPSLRVETQPSKFLQKQKTVTSETPQEKQPISKETAALVVNKLSQLKIKGVENAKLKNAQPNSLSPNKDRFPDLSETSSPNDSPIKFAYTENSGFLEKIDDQNEDQSKAKQALNMIKKEKKKQNRDQSNPKVDIIPLLNNQMNHFANQRATIIDDLHRPGPRHEQKVTSNFKIDDPNSILHIANYQQNKEFLDYAKVYSNNEGKKVLKINAPDCQTFFRLHHEINEINRKREEFLNMKKKFFDQKDPAEIVDYDQTIKATGAVLNPEEFKKKLKTTKEYQRGERLAKKFTSKIEIQHKTKMNEAQVANFLSMNRSPEHPKKSQFHVEDD